MHIYLLEYKFMTRVVVQRSTPRSCRAITFGHASPTWFVLFLSHYKWFQARSPNPDFQCRIWPTRLLTRKQALRPSSNSRMHSLTYTSREHAFVKLQHTDSQSSRQQAACGALLPFNTTPAALVFLPLFPYSLFDTHNDLNFHLQRLPLSVSASVSLSLSLSLTLFSLSLSLSQCPASASGVLQEA